MPNRESRAIITGAINDRRSKLTIWTPNQRHTLQTRISNTTEVGAAFFVGIRNDPEEKAFIEKVANEGISSCYFSLNVTTDILFFQAEYRSGNTAFPSFRVKEPVFKVQRRQAFRLRIPESAKIFAHFHFPHPSDPEIKARVMDISSGGVGLFLEDPAHADAFQSGTTLHHIRFSFRGRSFDLHGVVRHKRPLNYKVRSGYGIGISFSTISHSDEAFISQAVLEETVKFFGRG